MASTAQQECFGDAFLLAVAGVAGCAVSPRRPDDDSIDWTLSCRLSQRPKLVVQMKTTTTLEGDSGAFHYPLKRKNYDDLILDDVLSPRILVLVILPRSIDEWLTTTPEQFALRTCAYWVSLAGWPTTENATTVTVSVPQANLFSVEALTKMMHHINSEGRLP